MPQAPLLKCEGPCRQKLPPEAFAKNGAYRRRTCNKCRNRERTAQRIKERQEALPKIETATTKLPKAERYVVTWAQNATPVFKPFWEALNVYCERNNAELVVIPGRYHNPTSHWSARAQSHDWWASELLGHLYRGEMIIHGQFAILGGISIQPTAVRPLSGMEIHVGQRSAVFGHPKIQVQTVATATRTARIMATTGACTLPNYTESKAGMKARGHHVFGAAVLECGLGGAVFTRQINATSDGSFIDLDKRYTRNGVEAAPRALALVLGDVHADRVNRGVCLATWGRLAPHHAALQGRRATGVAKPAPSMVDVLQPRRLFYHDLLDFGVRNHHSIRNHRRRFAQALGHAPDCVESEVERAIRLIDELTPKNATPYVVGSNHDEAFDRWLESGEPESYGDYVNERFWLQTKAGLRTVQENTGKSIGAFEFVYRERGQGRAQFLQRGEDCTVHNVHFAFHGDKGINGSRGSPLAYSKLGAKVVIGHGHSPAVLDGAYVVGTSSDLDMGYNDIPSSWAHAHCVQYANGKRSLLFIHEDRWRV